LLYDKDDESFPNLSAIEARRLYKKFRIYSNGGSLQLAGSGPYIVLIESFLILIFRMRNKRHHIHQRILIL